jgi:arylsulfatase A-like enzyme
VAGALLAALGLLTVAWIQRELLGVQSWRWWGRDQVWMIPLGYLMVFGPLAVLLTLLHLAAPRRISLATVGAVVLATAAFATLLFFGRIAPAAWAVLALGVGVRSWQSLSRTDDGGWRLWRGAAVTLAIGFLLAAGWNLGGQARRESQALAALPATAPDAPNVLLIILDTVRQEGFRLAGGDSATAPALGRRAQGGVVFDSAYSTAPWTLPSHASMFTGRYASRQSGDWKSPLDDAPRTIAEVFRTNGYATGGFTANQLATGYRTGLARGFIRYSDVERSVPEVLFSTTITQSGSFWRAWRTWQDQRWLGRAVRQLAEFDLRPNGNYQLHERKLAADVTRDFLDWQQGLGDRRFFAFLNLFDAHAPYDPPAPYDTMYAPRGRDYGKYLGGIRYMDDVVDRTLQELEARGVLRNTIVVVTSDHGELFGEHGLRGHGNNLYRPVLHVPLVILPPAADATPRRVGRNVSLRDLAATILDLAGLCGDTDGIDGTSLLPLMRGDSDAPSSPVIAEVNRGINERADTPTAGADLKTALDDAVQVIESSAGRVEAYRYRQDPHDSVDVARDPATRAELSAWADRMFRDMQIVWPNGRGGGESGPRVP